MKEKYYKGLVADEPETWIYGRLLSGNRIFQNFEPSKGTCGVGAFSVIPSSISEISEEQYLSEYNRSNTVSYNFSGIVRPVTAGGRICVPAEFRHSAGIQSLEKVELFLTLLKEILICTPENNTRDFYGIECTFARNGQILIPVEYRKAIGLKVGSKVEIFMNKQKEIIIRLQKI